jgi:hypothetical protein
MLSVYSLNFLKQVTDAHEVLVNVLLLEAT